jgi:hypothetical protein
VDVNVPILLRRLGHSTALIFVAVIFIACEGEINLDKMAVYCDWIVGVVRHAGCIIGTRVVCLIPPVSQHTHSS